MANKSDAPQARVKPKKPVKPAAKAAAPPPAEADDEEGAEADQEATEAQGGEQEAQDGPQGDGSTADPAPGTGVDAEEGQKAASEAPKAAAGENEQAGFAKRVGRASTKAVKQPTMPRPYLDSPREFGIHVKGLLVRFKKGRTALTTEHWHGTVPLADVLKALRTDSYVADNGAELVE